MKRASLAGIALASLALACTEKGRSVVLVDVTPAIGLAMPPRGRAIVATNNDEWLAQAEGEWTSAQPTLKLGVYVPKTVSGSVKVIARALSAARQVIDGKVMAGTVDVSPGMETKPVALMLTSGTPSLLCRDADAGVAGHGGAGGSTGGSGGRGGTAGSAGTGGGGTGGSAGIGGSAGTGGSGGSAGGTGGSGGGTGGQAGRGGAGGTGGSVAGTGEVADSGGRGGTGGSVAGTGGSAGTTGLAGRGGAGGTGGSAGGTGGSAAGTGGTGTNQCADGMMNGAETDVDCGGGTCPKCNVNKVCGADTDCKTGSCSRLFCALVSGPPNWSAGPALNYVRGFVTAGVAVGGGQSTMFVNGGRDVPTLPIRR